MPNALARVAELDADGVRSAIGDLMAIGFLVELLLADYLQRVPEDIREQLVETTREAGKETSDLADLALDEQKAELLADITVKMHQALDGYLDRALERVSITRPTYSR